MKIAFIGQKGISAKAGGVEGRAMELAVKLVEGGHEVFVYARKNYTDKKSKQYKGVKLVHIPNLLAKNTGDMIHALFSIGHAIFQKYDVVHIHSIGPNALNFLIKIFNPKTVLIATYHRKDYLHQKWGGIARAYLKLGAHMTCRIPDRTIVATEILKNFIQKEFGRSAEVIPDGVNVSWNENFDKLAQWNLPKGEYILAVSRLIRHKGLHYLVKAFLELEKKNLARGKKLVIVGEGFYATDYVKYLKSLASGSENIVFTGRQASEDLSQLFSHAYAFVQPSDSGELSSVLLEAMGYGNAVIASNIPENLEAIGEAGVAFSQGNVADLRDRMAELIADEKRATILREAAKSRVRLSYSGEHIAQETVNLYEEEAGKKSNKQFYTQKSNI